jgi:hypothetical protein
MREFILVQVEAKHVESGTVAACDVSIKSIAISDSERFTELVKQSIGSDNFDVKQVMIDGQRIDIWHDDYYNPKALDKQVGLAFEYGEGEYMPIFGSVIMAGCSEDGKTISCPISSERIVELVQDGKIRFVTAKQIDTDMTVEISEEKAEQNIPSDAFFFAPQTNQSSAIH